MQPGTEAAPWGRDGWDPSPRGAGHAASRDLLALRSWDPGYEQECDAMKGQHNHTGKWPVGNPDMAKGDGAPTHHAGISAPGVGGHPAVS